MPKDSITAPQLSHILAIFIRWQLSPNEQASMLGLSSSEMANPSLLLEDQLKDYPDFLKRLVLIEAIDRWLRILYSSDESIRNWLRSPNHHELFCGQTALAVMSSGPDSLDAVAKLLAAWSVGY